MFSFHAALPQLEAASSATAPEEARPVQGRGWAQGQDVNKLYVNVNN